MICLKGVHLGAGHKMLIASFEINEEGLSNYKFDQERSKSDKVHEVLHAIPSHICLTTEIWSSYCNHDYLYLTAHYIDDAWLL
ncbi:hypothetical protein AMTRI_Chr04g246270 [Amborella trichopoda]